MVRLGDTVLTAVVEKDHAVYGDECLHGGGKTLRDGIGMAGITSAEGALDFLLCNVVIIDPVVGIVKGDLGIRRGRIVGIGKAGNPAIMDGVDPRLIVSSGTTVLYCEGLIATPGAIDVHVHLDSGGLVEHALASGITTMIGGSLGPITVGIDPGGPLNTGKMLQAADSVADEFRLLGTRQLASWTAASRAARNRCDGAAESIPTVIGPSEPPIVVVIPLASACSTEPGAVEMDVNVDCTGGSDELGS